MNTRHRVRNAQKDEAVAVDPADRTVAGHGRRPLGQWRGQVRMSDDFDAPLPEAEREAWLGERS